MKSVIYEVKHATHKTVMMMIESACFPYTIEMIRVMHDVRDVADRQILPIRAYVKGNDNVIAEITNEKFTGTIDILPLDMPIRDIVI